MNANDSFDDLISASLRGGKRSLMADDAYVARLMYETRPFASIRNHPKRVCLVVGALCLVMGGWAGGVALGVVPAPFSGRAQGVVAASTVVAKTGEETVVVPVAKANGPRVEKRSVADLGAPRDNVDRAIDNALAYLKQQQRGDGTFPGGSGDTAAIPALVGMAFMSKGILPMDEERGATIRKCLDYVLGCANMRDDQKFKGYMGEKGNGRMYAHSIATLFLSECSGMVDDEYQAKIDAILPYAVKVIVDAQAQQKGAQHLGGWRYTPNASDSDLSCSGWALMALKSARLNGAQVPDEAIEKAVMYIKRAHSQDRGTFGYQGANGGNSETLSGAAILCLELCGKHLDADSMRAAKYLKGNFKQTLSNSGHRYYGLYYTAQGLFQIGGEYWKEFEPWMYEEYLKRQKPEGSWPGDSVGSEPYATAMTVLAFTVPYRMLPIYQRDETVDE